MRKKWDTVISAIIEHHPVIPLHRLGVGKSKIGCAKFTYDHPFNSEAEYPYQMNPGAVTEETAPFFIYVTNARFFDVYG